MNCKYNRPRDPEPSYTHALHAHECQLAAQARQVLQKRVLVRKGQIVYCATIKAAYTVPDGPDCWTVETSWPERARFTVACKNTIACPEACCSCMGPSSPVSDSASDLRVTCL